MLVGGLWALWGIRNALAGALRRVSTHAGDDAQRDLPRSFLLVLLLLLTVPMFLFYRHLLGSAALAMPLTGLMLVAAFVFSAVAGYMAGLVGSSNNPISGVTIATILFTALALQLIAGNGSAGAVAAVMVGAVVCCAAAIGGDNLQDLKAGTVLGATPWKQQIAQMVGVVSAVCVLAPVLSLLMHAYGIGAPTAAHPHPLPAPQANLMAAVAQGVFGGSLPWRMVGAGALLGVAVIAVDEYQRRRSHAFRLPVLAVAVGVYLPLELSVPIALGGCIARLGGDGAHGVRGAGMLAAAGLITGEALMGIALAVPIVLSGSADVLALGRSWGAMPGLLLMAGLGLWLAWLQRART
jgi:putative OPT family oligopeptide transporter